MVSISTWYQSKSDSKIPTIYTLFSADSKISSKWLHPFQPHWIYWGHFHFYQASGVVRVPQLTNDSSIVVTSHRFNGDNYLSWSRRIEMFITRKSKKRNTYMDSPIPSETDANFRLWKSENSMILSWLIRPMQPDISDDFMMYNTAAEIWDPVKENTLNDYLPDFICR